MVWQYEKFKGDMAIYAFCPKCNFHHNPSELNHAIMECEIQYQYHYCPMCGEYLYNDKAETDGVDITWNERHILELYNIKDSF